MITASHHCGWTGTYRTQPLADNALRRHSCERQAMLRDRAERVTARKTASGPERDCQHKRASHVHGTRAAYVLDRCRCRPCREASTASQRGRTRQIAYGRWQPYADAQPVREHLWDLQAAGMGPKRVAVVSGVGHGIISAILYGKWLEDGTRRRPTRRIRPATAQKLLAVQATVDTLGATVRVDPTGTRRRLEALIACGWSVGAISTAPYYDHLAEVAATHIANATPDGHCPLCGCNADTLIHGIGRALAAWRGEHNLNLDLTARIQHLTTKETVR